ncbi:MAG: DNA polymerase III subunit gamma/tau [Mycoplasmataceae bacterium]|nr:DNA polymerase III subunit gamma/tau [Mycoplasmataceae bacterium]
MSNKQSLYTKYRPTNFNEVIGQKIAKDILVNSISKGKINHAYLFYGIRGTGKTTLARIFSKAVNCHELIENNPCNECDICVSINNGSAFDVIEIDAASNNGVDEIRLIKENTSYLTTSTKYKVYIIDEVHMLTKAAFNALLKTLEEPPENTIFLLATTEIQKIPQTVLSRTIIINLEVMSNEDIIKGLKVICDEEKITYDYESLEYLTMVSGGSLRDAISFLETSLLYNEELIVSNVIDALGLIKKTEIKRMILNDVEELINEINKTDKDPKRIGLIILEVLMNLIKDGYLKYVSILNSVMNYMNTIKDPFLLKISLKSSLYNINVSHETNKNEYVENFKKESKTQEKSIVENITTNEFKIIENPKNIEVNEELDKKIIVENTQEIQKINEKKNVENIKKYSINLNIITDFADVNNYMYIIKMNDEKEFSKIQARWRYIDNYITSKDYKLIASSLVRTQPLASTKKTIIVGFHNESQINEFKRISLTKEYFVFIKEILGEYKFILPISSKTWSKLLSVKDNIKLKDIHTDLSIKIEDYIENENNEIKNKLNNLFGEDNIIHE